MMGSPEHDLEEGDTPPRSPSVKSNGSPTRKRTRDDELKASGDKTSGSSAEGESSSATGTQTLATGGIGVASNGNNHGPSRNTRFSSEDLLAPTPKFDWDKFQDQCRDEIQDTNDEESALLEEYRQWQWLHNVWTQSRSTSDTVRLNQEIMTISRWTELKEAELEEARMQHKNNLEQISMVLGIISPS